MRVVELRTAYQWWCDDCGHKNFAMPQKAELTNEQREQAYRKFNLLEEFAELPDGWMDFEMVNLPDTVTCERCLNTFQTVDEI